LRRFPGFMVPAKKTPTPGRPGRIRGNRTVPSRSATDGTPRTGRLVETALYKRNREPSRILNYLRW